KYLFAKEEINFLREKFKEKYGYLPRIEDISDEVLEKQIEEIIKLVEERIKEEYLQFLPSQILASQDKGFLERLFVYFTFNFNITSTHFIFSPVFSYEFFRDPSLEGGQRIIKEINQKVKDLDIPACIERFNNLKEYYETIWEDKSKSNFERFKALYLLHIYRVKIEILEQWEKDLFKKSPVKRKSQKQLLQKRVSGKEKEETGVEKESAQNLIEELVKSAKEEKLPLKQLPQNISLKKIEEILNWNKNYASKEDFYKWVNSQKFISSLQNIINKAKTAYEVEEAGRLLFCYPVKFPQNSLNKAEQRLREILKRRGLSPNLIEKRLKKFEKEMLSLHKESLEKEVFSLAERKLTLNSNLERINEVLNKIEGKINSPYFRKDDFIPSSYLVCGIKKSPLSKILPKDISKERVVEELNRLIREKNLYQILEEENYPLPYYIKEFAQEKIEKEFLNRLILEYMLSDYYCAENSRKLINRRRNLEKEKEKVDKELSFLEKEENKIKEEIKTRKFNIDFDALYKSSYGKLKERFSSFWNTYFVERNEYRYKEKKVKKSFYAFFKDLFPEGSFEEKQNAFKILQALFVKGEKEFFGLKEAEVNFEGKKIKINYLWFEERIEELRKNLKREKLLKEFKEEEFREKEDKELKNTIDEILNKMPSEKSKSFLKHLLSILPLIPVEDEKVPSTKPVVVVPQGQRERLEKLYEGYREYLSSPARTQIEAMLDIFSKINKGGLDEFIKTKLRSPPADIYNLLKETAQKYPLRIKLEKEVTLRKILAQYLPLVDRRATFKSLALFFLVSYYKSSENQSFYYRQFIKNIILSFFILSGDTLHYNYEFSNKKDFQKIVKDLEEKELIPQISLDTNLLEIALALAQPGLTKEEREQLEKLAFDYYKAYLASLLKANLFYAKYLEHPFRSKNYTVASDLTATLIILGMNLLKSIIPSSQKERLSNLKPYLIDIVKNLAQPQKEKKERPEFESVIYKGKIYLTFTNGLLFTSTKKVLLFPLLDASYLMENIILRQEGEEIGVSNLYFSLHPTVVRQEYGFFARQYNRLYLTQNTSLDLIYSVFATPKNLSLKLNTPQYQTFEASLNEELEKYGIGLKQTVLYLHRRDGDDSIYISLGIDKEKTSLMTGVEITQEGKLFFISGRQKYSLGKQKEGVFIFSVKGDETAVQISQNWGRTTFRILGITEGEGNLTLSGEIIRRFEKVSLGVGVEYQRYNEEKSLIPSFLVEVEEFLGVRSTFSVGYDVKRDNPVFGFYFQRSWEGGFLPYARGNYSQGAYDINGGLIRYWQRYYSDVYFGYSYNPYAGIGGGGDWFSVEGGYDEGPVGRINFYLFNNYRNPSMGKPQKVLFYSPVVFPPYLLGDKSMQILEEALNNLSKKGKSIKNKEFKRLTKNVSYFEKVKRAYDKKAKGKNLLFSNFEELAFYLVKAIKILKTIDKGNYYI
ncbi:MAG: hypothetical protein DRP80_07095, partial [Candidatus Omnitrophota bacterium]